MKKLLCAILCLCLFVPALACADRTVVTALAAELEEPAAPEAERCDPLNYRPVRIVHFSHCFSSVKRV